IVTSGATASFSVTATGTAPLAYQWRLEGAAITGATNSTLVISNVQNANAGNYSVRVTNSTGFVVSSNASLTVNPLVTSQTYDLSHDFSIMNNPNGAWSYGAKTNLGGAFTLLTFAQSQTVQ